jgi:hypothetical protein
VNSYEKFKKEFLTELAQPAMGDPRHYRHLLLSQQYGIQDRHIRELLIQWAREGLISITCYDGARARPWHEWASADDMFFNTTDNGYVRVSILAAGAALVEDLPAHRIGFVNA